MAAFKFLLFVEAAHEIAFEALIRKGIDVSPGAVSGPAMSVMRVITREGE